MADIVSRCKSCGSPVVQVPGRRKREFCNGACRQRHYRSKLRPEPKAQAPIDTAILTELERLRVQLKRETLRAEAASTALTESQYQRSILAEKVFQLEYLLDIEKRYHQDIQSRGLKAWLKKQPPSPLSTKLLADELLPPRGSRGLYEAHLRLQQYTADEMQEFAHLWKALLLSQP